MGNSPAAESMSKGAFNARSHGLSARRGGTVVLALILSAVMHLGLGSVIATSGEGRGHRAAGIRAGERALTVQLRELPGVRSAPRAALQEAGKPADTPVPFEPHAAAQPAQDTPAPVAIAKLPGPYYFRASELTEPPAPLHDAVAGLILLAPGLPPQPVILRLLINDEGGVDRVVTEESYLSEEIAERVTDAFSKVTFAPGKIGRIAVRSQLRVEVQLESVERQLRTALH